MPVPMLPYHQNNWPADLDQRAAADMQHPDDRGKAGRPVGSKSRQTNRSGIRGWRGRRSEYLRATGRLSDYQKEYR